MTRKLLGALILAVVATSAIAPAHALQMPARAPVDIGHVLTVQYGGGYGHKYSERHYRWCENRYRSYQRASNSYWNSYGQQRQCRSPYM